MKQSFKRVPFAAALVADLLPSAGYSADTSFRLMDASINEIHQAMRTGTLTCHGLVRQYLDRIHAYDKQGPALNAMLYVNPNALAQADAMDRQFERTGK